MAGGVRPVSGGGCMAGQWRGVYGRSVAGGVWPVSGGGCTAGQWRGVYGRSVAGGVWPVSGGGCTAGQWRGVYGRSVAGGVRYNHRNVRKSQLSWRCADVQKDRNVLTS